MIERHVNPWSQALYACDVHLKELELKPVDGQMALVCPTCSKSWKLWIEQHQVQAMKEAA